MTILKYIGTWEELEKRGFENPTDEEIKELVDYDIYADDLIQACLVEKVEE